VKTPSFALLLCTLMLPMAHAAESIATFAGGCFWCTESDFEKVPGVLSAVSGYAGGTVDDPGYQGVSAGRTGHAESVEVRFDPSVTSYEKLLEIYWHSVDPYTPDAQFCDHGPQYRTAIFAHDDAQRTAAEHSRDELQKQFPDRPPIVTQIVAAPRFWPAEDYHQDYYKKNPVRYRYYRWGCGRDQKLDELWGASRPH
jgi:peptide-methionine (S)-S-oxide reductase